MPKFLIDENLSPLLAKELNRLKYKAKAVREVGLKEKSDEEIIRFSAKERYIIITADIEFGEMFYRYKGKISIVLLKSKMQNRKSFVNILNNLNKKDILKQIPANNMLIIASEKDYRIRRFN